MLYYIFLQFNILILLILRKFTKIKEIIYIVVLFLILFSGLRYGVGVDFYSYYEHFQDILHNNSISIEPGIVLISKVAYFLNLNIQAVFFILSAITIFFFMKYIEFFTKNYLISWIIFISYGTYFLGSLNLVKQYVAISIFAFSIKYIYMKKPFKYIFFITIASLFHYSAIILFPMYFLNIRFKFKYYIIVVMIFYLIIHYLTFFIMMTKYSIYLNPSWAHTMNNNRNMMMVYLFIFLNILMLLFSYKITKKINYAYIFINMSFISLLLMFAAILIDYLPNMFFFRINDYFMIAYIIIPTLFLYDSNKNIRIIMNLVIIIFMYTYFFITLYFKGEEYHLIPYIFNYKII